MHVLCFLLIFCALPPLAAHSQETGTRGLQELRAQANHRIALCIGVNHYADTKLSSLKKAANDAYGLASVLEKQGDFKTYVFSDLDRDGKEKPVSARMLPTKRQVEEFLSDAISFGDIKKDDLVVFAFSGHGISDAKQNGYLLPMDWNGVDPYRTAIQVSSVIGWLQKLGVTKSLVLIDACREEMSTSRSLDTMPRLYDEKFLAANVSAVFYATRQGGFSYEDPESRYGAFTRFLIDGLSGAANANGDEVVTFRELSTYVEDGLGDWALKNGYRQRPYTRIFGEQSGDLALTAAFLTRVPERITAPPAPQRVETHPPRTDGSVLNSLGIRMVSIPGGTFQMGSTDIGSVEKPVHTVTLVSFEMSACEITQGQYMSVTGTTPSHFKGDDNLPVEYISWWDAVKFCNTVSRKSGLPECYNESNWMCDFTKSGFRLPTEAEWEYACRAGTTTKFYTGDAESDLDHAGWYYGNSGDRRLVAAGWDILTLRAANCRTHPVGQKTPNAWGLYDMHGNVWEWCQDWYGIYPSESVINPIGPQIGTSHVLRGGGWHDLENGCRSAHRFGPFPSDRNSGIGFRIVRRS